MTAQQTPHHCKNGAHWLKKDDLNKLQCSTCNASLLPPLTTHANRIKENRQRMTKTDRQPKVDDQ